MSTTPSLTFRRRLGAVGGQNLHPTAPGCTPLGHGTAAGALTCGVARRPNGVASPKAVAGAVAAPTIEGEAAATDGAIALRSGSLGSLVRWRVACLLRAGAAATSRWATQVPRRKDDRREAHVSAQQAQARQDARLPREDVHPRRSGRAQGTPPEGPPPAGCLIVEPRSTAPLRARRDFEALRDEGRRGSAPLCRVTFLADVPGSPRKVAYAIPRRCGTAVVRNRIRRRLRAALFELAGELSAGALLVHPDPACRSAAFAEVRRDLRQALVRAGALEEVAGR